MKSLKQIYNEKYSVLCDKGTSHCYIDIYENWFAPHREKEIVLLEVGILNGASISLWLDYFHNAKEIHGIDKNKRAFKATHLLDNPKVHLHFVDIRSEKINDVVKEKKFDIVIDDGSHKFGDQAKTIDIFKDKMNPGGMLIIEDVQSPEIGQKLHYNFPDFYLDDLQFLKNKKDDILFYKKF